MKYFSQNNKQTWWKPGKGEGWGEKIGGAFLLKLLPHRHVIFKANNIVWRININNTSNYNWNIVSTYSQKKLSGITNSENSNWWVCRILKKQNLQRNIFNLGFNSDAGWASRFLVSSHIFSVLHETGNNLSTLNQSLKAFVKSKL